MPTSSLPDTPGFYNGGGMSQADYCVRRATVDDLRGLVALWEAMHFPAMELERRLTEFQVVETPDGQLLGALGMAITGRHGQLHSEGFSDFALADDLRAQLWQRMQSLATNHGLVRVWTREKAPFWCHNGLRPATNDDLKKLPQAWNSAPGDWLTLELRDEAAVEATLDTQFARFKQEAREQTEQALRRARVLKAFATFIAIILAVFVVIASLYILKSRGLLGPRP